jgi:competence protein ComEC
VTLPVRSRAPDRHQQRPPPDLRLVPAALAVWAVALLGIGLGPVAGVVVLAGGVLLVGVTVVRHRGAAWAGGALAVGGCAAAAALVVTAHALLLDRHPLRGPAERGAAAGLRVVVTDDPRPIRTPGYGARPGEASQVLVPVLLERAEVGDSSWEVGGRMLLIAPAAEWAALLPGQAATAEGLLAPAGRRDLTVAVLRVRGPPAGISPPPWWQHAAGGLRDGLRDAASVLPQAPGGLLPGLAVGDRSRLTAEVEADFRAAGLAHLLAVSGEKARQTHVWQTTYAERTLESAGEDVRGSAARERCQRGDDVFKGGLRDDSVAILPRCGVHVNDDAIVALKG